MDLITLMNLMDLVVFALAFGPHHFLLVDLVLSDLGLSQVRVFVALLGQLQAFELVYRLHSFEFVQGHFALLGIPVPLGLFFLGSFFLEEAVGGGLGGEGVGEGRGGCVVVGGLGGVVVVVVVEG